MDDLTVEIGYVNDDFTKNIATVPGDSGDTDIPKCRMRKGDYAESCLKELAGVLHPADGHHEPFMHKES